MNLKYMLRMSYSIGNKIIFSVSIVQWVCFLKEIKKIITDVKKFMDVFNVMYLKDAQLYLYAMIHMQRHKHL